MTLTDAQSIKSAFDRAAGRAATVHYVGMSAGGFAAYAVGSSRDVDTAYTVTVGPDGRFRCTCAGELRPACWHRAAVFNARASREAFGLPASPVAVPPPAGPRRLPPRDEADPSGEDAARRQRAARRLDAIAQEMAR